MYSLVIGLAVIVAAPAPKEAKKAPITLLGDWSVESVSALGRPQPPDQSQKTIRFSADGATSTVDGNVAAPDVSKFTHDAKASPATIDLEKDGMKFPGIYKIEGDILTICLTFQGERPATFTASGNNILYSMKRVTKD